VLETLRRRALTAPPNLSSKNLKWESRVDRVGKPIGNSPKVSRPAKLTSVKSVGISHDQNERWRKTMEDESISVDKFGGNPLSGYFAVYDGHGYSYFAELLKPSVEKKWYSL
jgi:hypothetical protein